MVTSDPRMRFSKPSFWIRMDPSISFSTPFTSATQVVRGPSIVRVLTRRRSWIIRRAPRVRNRLQRAKKPMNVVPAE